MRHHNEVKKFGRVSRQRTALLRSLARSLIIYEKIETTEARAKALRPFIEKLVTRGKSETLSSQRIVMARLGSGAKREVFKIFKVLAPRYKDRKGGYTRITKTGSRFDDGRQAAVIEFV